jgi:hypothetical protein
LEGVDFDRSCRTEYLPRSGDLFNHPGFKSHFGSVGRLRLPIELCGPFSSTCGGPDACRTSWEAAPSRPPLVGPTVGRAGELIGTVLRAGPVDRLGGCARRCCLGEHQPRRAARVQQRRPEERLLPLPEERLPGRGLRSLATPRPGSGAERFDQADRLKPSRIDAAYGCGDSPGFQRISPAGGLAARARMKSRSDSRFR